MARKVSKESVRYRRASTKAPRRCGTCAMFRAPAGCTLVAGLIRRGDVCNRWVSSRTGARL